MQWSYDHIMLFLFDIDGTLLRRMPPAHRQALCEAAEIVYGLRLSPDDLGQTAGMTDISIIRRAIAGAEVNTATLEAGLPEFFEQASVAYECLAPDDLRPYHTPHAERVLAWLSERDGHLGLVTGNIERIAWAKLRAAGLAEYFRCGAFGDDAEERNELPALAIERARHVFKMSFAAEESYVIGDTPADIACGAACGMRTVAVATGVVHSLDTLRSYGPDYAFEDLGGLISPSFSC